MQRSSCFASAGTFQAFSICLFSWRSQRIFQSDRTKHLLTMLTVAHSCTCWKESQYESHHTQRALRKHNFGFVSTFAHLFTSFEASWTAHEWRRGVEFAFSQVSMQLSLTVLSALLRTRVCVQLFPENKFCHPVFAASCHPDAWLRTVYETCHLILQTYDHVHAHDSSQVRMENTSHTTQFSVPTPVSFTHGSRGTLMTALRLQRWVSGYGAVARAGWNLRVCWFLELAVSSRKRAITMFRKSAWWDAAGPLRTCTSTSKTRRGLSADWVVN